MTSDAVYEQCLPILQDPALEEEDKTDRLEDLIRKETSLSGKPLENAVLDTLWRFRNGGSTGAASSPVARHAVIRKHSPAPWQSSRSATPMASSPRSSTASPAAPAPVSLAGRPPLFRMRSSQRSPFTSPRPSPRLAFATPLSQTAVDVAVGPDTFGDYDASDWQDDVSNASSSYLGEPGAAAEFLSAQMTDMTPYDILRSVLRDQRSDEEIESTLEANGYNLSAAIAALTKGDSMAAAPQQQQPALATPELARTYLVGKSMDQGSRPVTPSGQQQSNIVCRYMNECRRADCRFSHDLTAHVCKYWLAGSCLAGDNCAFSHDPTALLSNMSLDGSQAYAVTPPVEPNLADYAAFPALSAGSPATSLSSLYSSAELPIGSSGGSTFSPRPGLAPEFIPSQPQSRPTSRQTSTLRGNAASFDDAEAFPTLTSAAATKGPKKHHGKRGHGHSHRGVNALASSATLASSEKDKLAPNSSSANNSSSLADIVRSSAALASATSSPTASAPKAPRAPASREHTAAAAAIPAPQHIPWLATGDAANKAYLAARAQAIKHGGARNKFLQSAAQAWNRQDVRAAKALSLRGQAENDAMREAHREAARCLYDERNRAVGANPGGEVYVDLHGLHPGEAVAYLLDALGDRRKRSGIERRVDDDDHGSKGGGGGGRAGWLYAIVGTGHHSKGGRDKVGKAVRGMLVERGFAFREFSVPNDRGGNGGILGVDVRSGSVAAAATTAGEDGTPATVLAAGDSSEAREREQQQQQQQQHGKIRILRAEDAAAAGAGHPTSPGVSVGGGGGGGAAAAAAAALGRRDK